MSDTSTPKIIFIAGANGGIGYAIATMALKDGNCVSLHSRNSDQELNALQKKYGKTRVITVSGDVTDGAIIHSILEQTVQHFGHLDALISTVGVKPQLESLADIDDSRVFAILRTELESTIYLVRGAVRQFLASARGGRIVIIGSDSGKVGASGQSISAACRGGAIALIKSVAREYASANILANVVCPGPTATSLWKQMSDPDGATGTIAAAMLRAVPMRRLATPEEVASVALFLSGDQASFITGQAISVSGGLTMA